MNIGRGDYLLIRTGQIEEHVSSGNWDGYPGGDAPGLAFETLDWLQAKEVAALATDTWGVEVRPNESEPGINQPWHWICIPIMGLTMGEIFKLDALADACADDRRYDFLFVAPVLPVTGGWFADKSHRDPLNCVIGVDGAEFAGRCPAWRVPPMAALGRRRELVPQQCWPPSPAGRTRYDWRDA